MAIPDRQGLIDGYTPYEVYDGGRKMRSVDDAIFFAKNFLGHQAVGEREFVPSRNTLSLQVEWWNDTAIYPFKVSIKFFF